MIRKNFYVDGPKLKCKFRIHGPKKFILNQEGVVGYRILVYEKYADPSNDDPIGIVYEGKIEFFTKGKVYGANGGNFSICSTLYSDTRSNALISKLEKEYPQFDFNFYNQMGVISKIVEIPKKLTSREK